MSFAKLCREADRKQQKDRRTENLRRLMADDISLDRAWRELNKRAPGDIPIATLHAAEFLMQVGDLQRWRKWFDAHTADERAGILRHLDSKKGGKP